MTTPTTAAGRALVEEWADEGQGPVASDIIAIEREAAQQERERIRAGIDLDRIIERHGCRDNDMGIPCSFHAHLDAILEKYERMTIYSAAEDRSTARLRDQADTIPPTSAAADLDVALLECGCGHPITAHRLLDNGPSRYPVGWCKDCEGTEGYTHYPYAADLDVEALAAALEEADLQVRQQMASGIQPGFRGWQEYAAIIAAAYAEARQK